MILYFSMFVSLMQDSFYWFLSDVLNTQSDKKLRGDVGEGTVIGKICPEWPERESLTEKIQSPVQAGQILPSRLKAHVYI
jgi:hypothetical protein